MLEGQLRPGGRGKVVCTLPPIMNKMLDCCFQKRTSEEESTAIWGSKAFLKQGDQEIRRRVSGTAGFVGPSAQMLAVSALKLTGSEPSATPCTAPAGTTRVQATHSERTSFKPTLGTRWRLACTMPWSTEQGRIGGGMLLD